VRGRHPVLDLRTPALHDYGGFYHGHWGEPEMPIYVSLVKWTDQGLKNYRDTVDRARDYSALVERLGGRTRELLWAIGEYDIVTVAEFPDDETGVAAMLQVGALGSVRTTTMRAFDAEEMTGIIARAG
jgi:uncharacterized protein with GYD domain